MTEPALCELCDKEFYPTYSVKSDEYGYIDICQKCEDRCLD
jgi:hypothetical protein